MKKTLAFVILLLTLSGSTIFAGCGKTPKWLDGTWTGTGYQTDGATWSVELSKTEGNPDLTISYPSLDCGGKWVIVSASRKRIELEEILSSGTDRCDKDVKVTLFKIDDEQLSVIFFLPSYQEHAIAQAVLTRQ